MITYSSKKKTEKQNFLTLADLSKVIHVMTLVQPYVEQAYSSSEAAAKQMGYCLEWLEKYSSGASVDAYNEMLDKTDEDGGRELEEFNEDIVRLWSRLISQDGKLESTHLESFVLFCGCHLGFIQQLSEQQKEQGADEVAFIMEDALAKLTPLIEFADQVNADGDILKIELSG